MNRMRMSALIAAAALAGLLTAGCGPSKEQMSMAKAMSSRCDRAPDYNASAQFIHSYCQKKDKDYVVWAMEYGSLCILGGNYDAARAELTACYADIEKRQDKNKETVAALAAENAKLFKGEPFERAMLCSYLGMLNYIEGDYNTARIFCARADMEDATTNENKKEFRHDFQLAHYWLARSYMRLGEEDNARIALEKAMQRLPRKGEDAEAARIRKAQNKARQNRVKLEKESFKRATTCKPPVEGAADVSAAPAIAQMPEELGTATSPSPVELCAQNPEQFFSLDYQKEVNLILVIEVGAGPIRFVNDYGDTIIRGAYDERNVMVYLDGHRAGVAVPMIDIFHQADTRGTSEKDTAQAAKGVTKAVLKQLPYVSYAANYWDVRADDRYWKLLPGEVHVLAAKVKPGVYTVNLQCFDSNGYALPRYSLTRYCVPVRAGEENIYILSTRVEADNTYVSAAK